MEHGPRAGFFLPVDVGDVGMPSIRLISDLHLSENTPELIRWFAHLVLDSQYDEQIMSLYILGDWFDYWIGDDDDRVFLPEIIRVCRAFSEYKPLYVMHGNRDFLLGKTFLDRCGATLLAQDVHIVNEALLLCHGDHLCLDDVPYLAFRQQSRQSAWQQHVLRKPLAERQMLAQMIRQESQMNGQWADVAERALVHVQNEHPGVRVLVHGHTHLPGRHPLPVGGVRWVLQDWRSDRYGYLDVDPEYPEGAVHYIQFDDG